MINKNTMLIKVEKLKKVYKGSDKPALQGITFDVARGEKVGLIGSNGSGKTTLLRLLMNFILPDEGIIRINGKTDLELAHRHIGFVAESQKGLENFTPRELFKAAARMHGMDTKQSLQRIEELLEFSGLRDAADELIEGFSKGMAQRTFICIAIMHDPDILLLDEPMSGMDLQGQTNVRDLLKKLADKTIIYASHNLEEIEAFTSSVIFLHQGKIVHRIMLNEIDREVFQLEIDAQIKPFLNSFQNLLPQINAEAGQRIELRLIADSKDFKHFMDFCQNRNVSIHRIRSRSQLEDIYYQYVRTPNFSS